MAKEEAQPEQEPAKGGSKKLIIIIAAVVLVLLLGGGAAVFLMKGSKAPAEDGDDEATEAEAEGEEGEGGEGGAMAPAIMPLETFIVNLQVKGSFLKTTIQLEFAEPEIPKTAEADIPKIRDVVIRLMSAKSAADILNTEGKERLREELRDGINQVLGAEDVTQVYFTEFIIQ